MHCLPIHEDTSGDEDQPSEHRCDRAEEDDQPGHHESSAGQDDQETDHAKRANGAWGAGGASGIVMHASSARVAATAPSIFSPGRFDSLR